MVQSSSRKISIPPTYGKWKFHGWGREEATGGRGEERVTKAKVFNQTYGAKLEILEVTWDEPRFQSGK